MDIAISVITVCFNDLKNLQQTLLSLNDQTYKKFQSIVIDGGSTDGTLEYLQSFNLFKILYVSEPDNGLYDAMNKGLERASGKYINFMNAGDVFFDHTVLQSILEQADSAEVLYGHALKVNSDGTFHGNYHKHTPSVLTWKSFRSGMVVCHQSMIVTKKRALHFNLDYKISADIDWAIRVLKEVKSVKYLNETICKFQTGGISSKRKWKSWVERFKIIKHHFGLVDAIISHFEILFFYTLRRSGANGK